MNSMDEVINLNWLKKIAEKVLEKPGKSFYPPSLMSSREGDKLLLGNVKQAKEVKGVVTRDYGDILNRQGLLIVRNMKALYLQKVSESTEYAFEQNCDKLAGLFLNDASSVQKRGYTVTFHKNAFLDRIYVTIGGSKSVAESRFVIIRKTIEANGFFCGKLSKRTFLTFFNKEAYERNEEEDTPSQQTETEIEAQEASEPNNSILSDFSDAQLATCFKNYLKDARISLKGSFPNKDKQNQLLLYAYFYTNETFQKMKKVLLDQDISFGTKEKSFMIKLGKDELLKFLSKGKISIETSIAEKKEPQVEKGAQEIGVKPGIQEKTHRKNLDTVSDTFLSAIRPLVASLSKEAKLVLLSELQQENPASEKKMFDEIIDFLSFAEDDHHIVLVDSDDPFIMERSMIKPKLVEGAKIKKIIDEFLKI